MATIKDIAREAGVSVTTVSNVIHNRTARVSQNTIDKINALINKLDYTPNMYARSLALNSSKVIAYISTIYLNDPFNAAVIDTLEHALAKEGYYLMVKTISSPKELKLFLQNWSLDGLFFTGIYDGKMADVVSESGIPAVFVDSYYTCKNAVNVGLDDFNSAYSACEYLIKKGHRKITIVSQATCELGVNKARLSGFLQAMQDHSLAINPEYIYDTCSDSEYGITIGEKLAKSDITAIFAFSDVTAIQVMRGKVKAGKKIPDDISVIGFDDIDLCRLSSPQLTTVHQDTQRKATIAVDQLIKILSGSINNASQKNITLPTHIVERESVKFLQSSN